MGAIFDLLGSYIFKAAMIGIILSTSVTLNQIMVEKAQLVNLENNVNVALSVLEWDFRNIGYHYTGTAITKAENQQLQWYSDTENDGVVRTVRYSVSSHTETRGDSLVTRYDLVRFVSPSSMTVMKSLMSIQFSYQDASGATTTDVNAIRGIMVALTAETPVAVNGKYLTSFREFRIYPTNLLLN